MFLLKRFAIDIEVPRMKCYFQMKKQPILHIINFPYNLSGLIQMMCQ